MTFADLMQGRRACVNKRLPALRLRMEQFRIGIKMMTDSFDISNCASSVNALLDNRGRCAQLGECWFESASSNRGQKTLERGIVPFEFGPVGVSLLTGQHVMDIGQLDPFRDLRISQSAQPRQLGTNPLDQA